MLSGINGERGMPIALQIPSTGADTEGDCRSFSQQLQGSLAGEEKGLECAPQRFTITFKQSIKLD